MADKKQKRNNNKNYDEDYNPKFRKQRKKVCILCSDKNFELDYKNPDQLKKFVNDKGNILLYYHMLNNNKNAISQKTSVFGLIFFRKGMRNKHE